MRQLHQQLRIGILAVAIGACGGADAGSDEAPESAASVDQTPAAAAPASAATPATGAGTAHVSLTGVGAPVEGDFPTTLCGGPYIGREGMAFQTRAGDWRITIASEERQSGDVPLNEADDDVNVVVTANGPGMQLVRGPRNGGSLRVAENFRRAEADVELRSLVSRDTARLVATFTCE